MSFLQPWLLLALPLVALPIVIHLINQRRFQTIQWAAMMFLLAAQRMARGYSRLRQWLIMLFRMLVIAGLVLAVSRPLASGWLGSVAGGKADTTIVLFDRSPSMQEQAAGGGSSKLETGRQQKSTRLNSSHVEISYAVFCLKKKKKKKKKIKFKKKKKQNKKNNQTNNVKNKK